MWYPSENYKSQTWYRNTFLVKRFSHIAKVVSGSENKGWNNMADSGCHFACLAMIIGCDPAYLASVLSTVRPDYFRFDPSQKAVRLNDQKAIEFVWDMNKPHTVDRPVHIPNLWLGQKGFADVTVVLKTVSKIINYPTVVKEIAALRRKRLHIICGEAAHSMLVAGYQQGSYRLWEPDTSMLTNAQIREMIQKGIALNQIWDQLNISSENRFQVLGYHIESIYRKN